MWPKKSLQSIFDDDPFGLLNVKPSTTAAQNADERLIGTFEEINLFIDKYQREPHENGEMHEHSLWARLKGLRKQPEKSAQLKAYDRHKLFISEEKSINSIQDIFADDELGLFENVQSDLFNLVNVPQKEDRESTDFVARRKPCKNFDDYEPLFRSIQADLKNGKRQLTTFKLGNLRQGEFYVHNGVLFLLEEINISKKEHYRPDGTRVREDGRTRCVFENGTESNMLKRSVEKILYANGMVVTANADELNEQFVTAFSDVTAEDQESGYIYVLKSKSTKPEISQIKPLYKIGFAKTSVEERIKNALQEPTYLMAEVAIVSAYKCYNLNPQKFEQLVHNFFGKACLNVDVYDLNGNRHSPREWFVVPLGIIHEVILLIISGEIIHYQYDKESQSLIGKL